MTMQKSIIIANLFMILFVTLAICQSPESIAGEDGTPMMLIPAGEFQMGSSYGAGDEKPVHTAYTDAFYMDKYEITNAQYARFLNEYGKTTAYNGDLEKHEFLYINELSGIERIKGLFSPKPGYENHPVIQVTWYGASAYASYYGKRLPTEAEWEKAARGGLAGMQYPWGDVVPDGTHSNFADRSTNDEWSDRVAYDGYPYTAPVGSYMPNGYGLHDMAGNVWEWCADWYGYYPESYEKNPVGPSVGISRVLRGGAWNNTPTHIRVSCRYSRNPDLVNPKSSYYIGFRCARNATPEIR